MNSKVCLIVLDGWGIGEQNQSNPISRANTPNINEIKKYFPITSLQASGIAVGLPWLEEGNSEVGHLIMGAGQIIYQYYPRINKTIEDKTFFQNPVLNELMNHAKNNNSSCHLIGLLTSGNVHSSYTHLIALVDLARSLGLKDLKLHLFTDGRDSPSREGINLVQKLKEDLANRGVGEIASISGRFYAMDRDGNWNRIEKVWKIITQGINRTESDPEKYLEASYQQGANDEFIEPALMAQREGAKPNTIQDNDSIFFFNFREDSIRQLIQPFVNLNFDQFKITAPKKIYIASMTEIKDGLNIKVAFPKQAISNPLAKVLSDSNKRQLHLGESEKSAHITYFFNGLNEKPFPGEYWVIIPSLKTLHHEQSPQLMGPVITERLTQAIEENIYDFILVNYANPDLIGHTGDFEAALKCVNYIDGEIGKIASLCLIKNVTLVITADHGNLERMINPFTGRAETQHDPNPVPFYLIDNRFKLSSPKSEELIISQEKHIGGVLCDIAPTVLSLMGINKPDEMTGHDLLKILGLGI